MKQTISYEDFEKLDIRVGEVVEASAPEWSNKLIRMEVEFGEEIGKRVLFSGIRKWYRPEELVGKKMSFLVNMEPKKMGKEESQGMLMMADTEERPYLILLPEDIKPGTMIR